MRYTIRPRIGKEMMINVQKALATRDRSCLLKRFINAHNKTTNQIRSVITKNQKTELAVFMAKGIAPFKFTVFNSGDH
jgi:hypothetical protein